MPTYFWDTYALVQRQRGAATYARFENEAVTTHQMNVYELIAVLLRDFDERTAREQVRILRANLLEAETDDLVRAAHFRAKHKVSYVDALGYTLARKHEYVFLTGDKAFRSVEGVASVA